MAKGKQAQVGTRPDWYSSMMFQGWASIAFWMAVGLLLEGLLGYKIPSYLGDLQRRELFRLAHTHGAFLGIVLVVAALCGERAMIEPPLAAIRALRVGALIMPLAFLVAGLVHPEGDPGIAIWLVPPAALLIIFASIAFALSTRKKTGPEG